LVKEKVESKWKDEGWAVTVKKNKIKYPNMDSKFLFFILKRYNFKIFFNSNYKIK
jgi:hypothetical protein